LGNYRCILVSAFAHSDRKFDEHIASALREAGDDDIQIFASSMEAIDALEAADRIELLITRVSFPQGTPHGVALAKMARLKSERCRSCLWRARRTASTPSGSANFCRCQ
jgi:hypothetical protein